MPFVRFRMSDFRLTGMMLFSRHNNDHITLSLSTSEWQAALELLRTCEPKRLEFVHDLAKINSAHLKSYAGLVGAIYFVTLPAVASFLFAHPGTWNADNDILAYLIVSVVLGSLLFLKFFRDRWQAMELESCVAYAMAEAKFTGAPSHPKDQALPPAKHPPAGDAHAS
jgi:hypothetical protein